ERGNRALLRLAPGEELERARVRERPHVALLPPREPLDRGAVEADPVFERVLELRRRDRDTLEESEDVREPQPDEADVMLPRDLENVFDIVSLHEPPFRRPHS